MEIIVLFLVAFFAFLCGLWFGRFALSQSKYFKTQLELERKLGEAEGQKEAWQFVLKNINNNQSLDHETQKIIDEHFNDWFSQVKSLDS